MIKEQFERIVGLIGEDNFHKINNKKIAVIGLGGVGGTALEALTRSGFSHFVIIDFDKVDITNLNRQILYTKEDVGLFKVDAARKRISSINPDVQIIPFKEKISQEILDSLTVDFIIDAIDDIDGKILISEHCISNNIPFIVSLGMANRSDSSKVITTNLNRTTSDPLARKFRYELKKRNIDISNIKCVFSLEEPRNNGTKLFSCISATSSAGLKINSYLIDYFINN